MRSEPGEGVSLWNGPGIALRSGQGGGEFPLTVAEAPLGCGKGGWPRTKCPPRGWAPLGSLLALPSEKIRQCVTSGLAFFFRELLACRVVRETK